MNPHQNLLYRLWGKTNEREERKPDWEWRWHPAICHMVDVGYVADEWLRLDRQLLLRFHRLADCEIELSDLRRMIVLLVALHDLGKVHPEFQAKSEMGWANGYGASGAARPSGEGRGFDHGRASTLIAGELRLDWLNDWGCLIDVVAAHHGTFYTAGEVNPDSSGIPVETITRSIARCAVDVLSSLFRRPATIPPAPVGPGFAMLLAGFCSVADWLGSDSTVYTFVGDAVDSADALGRYLEALRGEGFNNGMPRAEWQLCSYGLINRFNIADTSTRTLFPYIETPRPLQTLAEDIPFGESHGPEMLVVEAPMGMGKTEIALLADARALKAQTASGLYFALPTQASSDALLDRVSLYAAAVADGPGSVSIMLAHGGRRFNARFSAMTEHTAMMFARLENARSDIGAYRDDVACPSEVIAPAWLAGAKQTLLAGIGVGTVDQAMMGAIAVKHHFVRLFALAGKVVVFDEIHAYDVYMNAVIVHLLRWLHVLGAKVVLLSATLPRTLRSKLLGAYEAGGVGATGATPMQDPYPQIVFSRAGTATSYTLPDSVNAAATMQETPIAVRRLESDGGDRTSVGVRRVLELAERGGCVAWIRNTVREAQEAWHQLSGHLATEAGRGVRLEILHARYTRADRGLIQDELIERLGRSSAERPDGLIVLATQVIEQSVDVDFDAMISDLAPVDLLLQRTGRLWRHERPAAERRGHRERALDVLVPSPAELRAMEFGGSGYVYDPEVLARSAELIGAESSWRPNADCRRLVAELYDLDATPDVDPDALARVRERRQNITVAMRGSASAVLCARPNDDLDFSTGPLRRDNDAGHVELATRYGGNSEAVVLLRRDERGNVVFQGRPDVCVERLPAARDFRAALAVEHAVALSTVGFPWYGPLDRGAEPAELVQLAAWWKERHPYDEHVFLLMESAGRLRHPQFIARYGDGRLPLEGLVFEEILRRPKESTMQFEEC